MKHFLAILLLLKLSLSYGQESTVPNSFINPNNEKVKLINEFLSLSPTDNIADIGTGSGYSLIPIANNCPDCKFTVEDIDSSTCNRRVLLKKINRSGNKSRIENFTFHYGTEKSTNLPTGNYNKILIFDVIHELTYKVEMLSDIRRILTKDGSIFIEEILVHKKIKKDRVCNYPFLTETEFKTVLSENDLFIKKERITFDTGKNRYFKIFECGVVN